MLLSLLLPSERTTLGREICITKRLSWHVGWSYCETTSQSHWWPKTGGGQLRSGGYGKSLGVVGKMSLISLCGLENHEDYSVLCDQRFYCERPSVALWTPPTTGQDKVSLKQKELFYVTCGNNDDIIFFFRGTDVNLRGFYLVIHFTKEEVPLCRRNYSFIYGIGWNK